MPTHAENNRERRGLVPLKRATIAAFGLYDRAARSWPWDRRYEVPEVGEHLVPGRDRRCFCNLQLEKVCNCRKASLRYTDAAALRGGATHRARLYYNDSFTWSLLASPRQARSRRPRPRSSRCSCHQRSKSPVPRLPEESHRRGDGTETHRRGAGRWNRAVGGGGV
jgi:hypothetical protein